MTPTELIEYRRALEADYAELAANVRRLDAIAIETVPDALDEVRLAGERELAIRNLERESALLHEVEGALERIAQGSYGVCLSCGEQIARKRLMAVPWAAYCLYCQELADRETGLGSPDAPYGSRAA